jgi:RNA polymerase sigma factor (sigma-70 family)
MDKNRQAQKVLYTKYVQLIKGVCMRYAANEEEAEDLVQETFIQVFNKIDTFKGDGALGGWIRKIAVNKSLEQYRKNKSLQNTKEGLILSIDNSPADFGVIEQLSLADLLAMIQRLPIGFRTVFNLYAVEGFTHQEIAENLGIAEGTSKSQYSRAKQQLVAWIEEEKMNEIKRLTHAKR